MADQTVGPAQVSVVTGEAARRLADKPVMVTVSDPAGFLGRSARLRLHRAGRVPAVLQRSMVIDQTGFFIGWMPDDLDGIILEAVPSDDAERQTSRSEPAIDPPRVEIRALSTAEAVARVILRRPSMARTLLRLLAARNIKGATFRFLRQFEALSAPSYRDWRAVRAQMEDDHPPAIANLTDAPTPLVLVSILGEGRGREASHESLKHQTYRANRLVEPEDVQTDLAHSLETGERFWMRLPAGVTLAPSALQWMVDCLIRHPQATGVYCDEDTVSRSGGKATPLFKPAWNLPLVESGWLPVDCILLRATCLPDKVDLRQLEPQALAIEASQAGDILHLPRILMHRPAPRAATLPSHPLQRLGGSIPPVTVIIPTRDRADLLSACLEGLLERTDRGALDIIVIDNDSKEDATRILLDRIEAEGHVRRLAMPGAFNFSRACNLGVAAARHERILLLNNDVEPLDRLWLGEMNAELDDPKVGAVGALLLYPDGYVQHGGVTLGAGSIARHSFHFHDLDGGEDQGLLAQRRHVSAVTAACLLTRKSHWLAVSGMDEAKLPVAFNDVDYCLKLRALDLDIVWTPHARLVHRESVSRGRDDTEEKRQRFAGEERVMFERWQAVIGNDPSYNPNCSLSAADFSLEAVPRDLSPRSARLPGSRIP